MTNYQNNNRLFNADCFSIFPLIEDKSIDMILCDLPYGTTACKWDTILPFDLLWEQYKRIIKDNGAIVLTASQPFTSALVMSNPKMFKYELIWQKPSPSNFAFANKGIMKFHENILIFYKKPPTFNPQKSIGSPNHQTKIGERKRANETGLNNKVLVINTNTLKNPKSVIKINREMGLHPTQKPVALMEYLIKTYTNEGETVLDNCMGSGTTGVACLKTNRQFIGIEKEEEYYNIAVKRIVEHNNL